jgi:hypothetical protein
MPLQLFPVSEMRPERPGALLDNGVAHDLNVVQVARAQVAQLAIVEITNFVIPT